MGMTPKTKREAIVQFFFVIMTLYFGMMIGMIGNYKEVIESWKANEDNDRVEILLMLSVLIASIAIPAVLLYSALT